MRSKAPTIIPLAAALSALGMDHAQANPAAPPDQTSGPTQSSEAVRNLAPANLHYSVGEDLFGMTVTKGADGVLFAQHQSHSSHASHSSHRSHTSGG